MLKNSVQADYLREQCVHELFEEQVQRTPGAVAVVLEGAQLTYQELNQRANQLAHHLRQQGVGPEVLVGLCLERSLEMIVGILAVLKAGGAYVPLDPGTPSERFAFVLQDSQMALLLTQTSLLLRLPVGHLAVVCLDADWHRISQHSQENLSRGAMSQHLAYMIYTSGSTGQPKGVLIEHRSILAHCWSVIEKYELSATDRVLQFYAFTFDPSVEQILSTLLVGARLVLRGEEIWSPGELLKAIKQQQLTVLDMPPAYWQQTLQEWMRRPQQLLGLPLRLVIVGGERLLPDVVHLWRRTPLEAMRLLNVYGPTEATITATYYDVAYYQEGGQAEEEAIPIGRPFANRVIYILDGAGTPVPIGVAGELYIGGVGVARGYLNRPDLTAERFIADPFGGTPEARLYRTGDIARYRADGNIEFLGRLDDQVKIRGYRIEPGEIEAILRQHPQVCQAVVVAQEDRAGKRLVAYLVAIQGSLPLPKTSELRHFLATKLPEYMVPTAFVFLEVFPLTSNGKLDRRALTALQLEQAEQNENYAAPETSIEEILAQVWMQVFGLKRVGIYDNFFDLGGHSLLATQIIARLDNILGIKLSLSTLFKSPTIVDLAMVIEEILLSEIEEEEMKRLIER